MLDIGSGGPGNPPYIGVDPYAPGADLKAFMWDLPYENYEVDKIYSSHALEHISKHDIHRTLREWRRVLKPDGELELLIPDLEWCVKHWLNNQTTGWELDIIFGHQSHEGEFHKTGFTRSIIEQYLRETGFRVESFEYIPTHGQQTMRIIAK